MNSGQDPRQLTAADLGIRGTVAEFQAVVLSALPEVTIRFGFVFGLITNPFEILARMKAFARARGATTLRIEARIRNRDLQNVMERRYGFKKRDDDIHVAILEL